MNAITPPPVSISERVQFLQAEVKGLASAHVLDLLAELLTCAQTCDEIARGGEAYRPGVRDICRRLDVDLRAAISTVQALEGRR